MTTLPQIDWALATRLGRRIVPAGPAIPRAQADEVVASLRRAADRAADIVAERSGLTNPSRAEVVVVDRPGWIAANAAMADELLREHAHRSPMGWVVSPATGLQAGLVLAIVSTRIVGQFEGLSENPRLLLVAPNVVSVERALGFDGEDFRLWACLHEQTHQFQFGHAPWLAPHVRGLATQLLDDEDDDEDGPDALGRLTAVMTFLEGHAEVQMDITAAGTIRSLPRLRRALDRRRRSPGVFAIVQRMVGLNQKVSQYQRGAAFCRYLHERGGLDMLNLPLSVPEFLPEPNEIDDPDAWLERVT